MRVAVAPVTLFAVSVVAMLACSCGGLNDARYAGWAVYEDREDGYRLFAPPGWSVSDDRRAGMRGSRFYPSEGFAHNELGFIYFIAFVGDLEGQAMPPAEVEQTLRSLINHEWQQIEMTSGSGELAGREATMLDLAGVLQYDGRRLQGRAAALQRDGKLFLFLAAAPQRTFDSLRETFELIYASVRLPE